VVVLKERRGPPPILGELPLQPSRRPAEPGGYDFKREIVWGDRTGHVLLML